MGVLSMLIITATIGFGNSTQSEPILTVMAKSGLKLRVQPSLDAPTLEVLQYGEDVTVSSDFVPTDNTTRIEWVEGNWIKVKHGDQEGFVFDGFLSPLNVPIHDTDFSVDINGLSHALYSWVFNNYSQLGTDTILVNESSQMLAYNFNEGILESYASPSLNKVTWEMEEVRIMDAYHLLESMLYTKKMRSVYKANTVFYTDKQGDVNKIKINDDLVEITRTDNGKVKITCKSIIEGC